MASIIFDRPASHRLNYNDVAIVPTETAVEMYNRWCSELNVSPTDTDYNYIAGQTNIIPLAKNFYHAFGTFNACVISDDCTLSFYENDPSGQNLVNISIIGDYDVNINVPGNPYPFITFFLSRIGSTSNNVSLFDFKMKNAANASIFLFDVFVKISNYPDQVKYAIKITDTEITVYGDTITRTSEGIYFGFLQYYLDNTIEKYGLNRFFSTSSYRALFNFYIDTYKIAGTIVDTLQASLFTATVHEFDTGSFITKKEIDTIVNNTFELFFHNAEPVSCTIQPKATVWRAGINAVAGDIVYPTQPGTTPYYYRCSTGGTTGPTEPAWTGNTGDQINDNGVIWDFVEQIVQPVTHAPLIPIKV